VTFAGTGRYLPDRVVTNDDLTKIVETTDEWIRTRTGIRERRLAPDDMTAAEMGARASRAALEDAGIGPEDVGIIIVSTATPDRWLPSTACDMQALLGASNAMAFDISAACSGWLYALSLAEGYLATGRADYALVVAAEKMSAILDWTDRTTCVLFGDGSGAAVLRRAEGAGEGIVSSFHRSDGNLADLLYRPGGGAACPMTPQVLESGDHLLRMSGKEIFKNAVRSMAEASSRALEAAGLTGEDIDLLIPHQANIRIIESTAKYAGIPMEKVYVNVDRFGNMSSASIPVALDEALREGTIQPGMKVLTATFGAGLTWGAMVWQF
jgi:3-oxoacyl-[acyl-carrier-protein] synthase-3